MNTQRIRKVVARALGGGLMGSLIVAAAATAAPGALDSSFGGSGIVSAGSGTQLFGVAVAPSKEVVATGQAGGAVLVDRFSSGGTTEWQYVGPGGVGRGVALQGDGKVVAAGGNGGMFVERLTAQGAPDGSFGNGGVAQAFGGGAIANAVGVQSDGKIVVAGSVPFSDFNGTSTRFAVARFNSNGSPDSSFGSGGHEVLDFGLPYAEAEGLAIHPDGHIYVVGREQGSNTYAFFNGVIARLNSNGSLDGSFNGGGVVSFHRSDGVGSGYDTLQAVTIQGDNKIVVAGADVGGTSAVFLRLNPNGSYDTSFNGSGAAYLSAGKGGAEPVGAYGVGIAGGGRIVGAGSMDIFSAYGGGLWATTPGGSPESTFGTGGAIESPQGAENCALAIAPDGSLVVAGATVSPTQSGRNPCTVSSGQTGFVARFVGYGAPPPGPSTGGTTTTTTSSTSTSTGAPAAARPVVTTGNAQRVGDIAATVSGQVNTEGGQTSYHVDYGTSRSYGSHSRSLTLGGASAPNGVAVRLTGLRPRTTYHFRLVASNSAGTSFGSDVTFRTTPRLSSRLRRVPARVSAGTLVRRGFAVGLTCNQACGATGALLLSAPDARRLGLGRHQTTIGSGRASLRRAGAGRLTIRLTHTAATKLRHVHGLRLTLRIAVTPAGGGSTVRSTKTITLTR